MLRVSAKATNTTIDIQGISGDASAAAMGIEHGPELMRFAESLARRNEPELTAARKDLLEAAGPGVLVEAAGIVANSHRMVQISASTCLPVY